LAFVSKPSPEEGPDAFDIPIKVPFGIGMPCADHLREVDHYWFTCISSNEDIELVEITVNKTTMSKPYDQVH
jgi:hypothetical protein